MLAKFKQNRIAQTILNFELCDQQKTGLLNPFLTKL